MTWSSVTGTPRKWKTRTGSGARPGASWMAWLPKIRVARDGRATDRPMVATTLVSGEDSRRWRKRIGVEDDPEQGSGDDDGYDAGRRDAPGLLGVEVVVEPGDDVRHRPEGEVEDARGRVGDDQAGGRDGVDPTEHQSRDHELQQLELPLYVPLDPPDAPGAGYPLIRVGPPSARPSTGSYTFFP